MFQNGNKTEWSIQELFVVAVAVVVGQVIVINFPTTSVGSKPILNNIPYVSLQFVDATHTSLYPHFD